MPDLQTQSRVIGDTNGALTILKAAQAGGLPMPDQIIVMDLHSTSTLTFYVRNLDELTHWSTWLDEPISDQVIGARVHHAVDGEMFDQPLRILAITKAAA
jgi:hypothetical protein